MELGIKLLSIHDPCLDAILLENIIFERNLKTLKYLLPCQLYFCYFQNTNLINNNYVNSCRVL